MRFYSVMGNRPDEPGALSLMAEILAKIATDEQIDVALERSTEVSYPVRLPHIRQRIPGLEISDTEAEARAEYDRAQQFAKKHVSSSPVDGNGVWVDDCRKRDCTLQFPHKLDEHLPERTRDSVRRVGGWRAIALSLKEPNPFLKKEFIAEYQAWRAVERASHKALLPSEIAQTFKRLVEAKEIR
jgi:hypothetical protein